MTNLMENRIIGLTEVENQIIEIRGQKVILDSDVANLYGIETKRVNEAVKNNPNKFPQGYIIELTDQELDDLRSKISTANFNKTRVQPKAFSEKGLYMLATILKSSKATETTIAIVEAFAKLRELARNMTIMSHEQDVEKQKSLLERSGEILDELLENNGDIIESESTIELNLAILKVKRTIKRKNNNSK